MSRRTQATLIQAGSVVAAAIAVVLFGVSIRAGSWGLAAIAFVLVGANAYLFNTLAEIKSQL